MEICAIDRGARLIINGAPLPEQADEVSIGRDPTCDVVVDHPRVSRQHAVLRRTASGWIFEDGNSLNGSFVEGGRRITSLAVNADVDLRLGNPDGARLEVRLVAATPVPPPGSGVVNARALGGGSPNSLGHLSRIVGTPSQMRLRIGRAPDNDVVVGDLRVSRRHAEIVRDATGAYKVVDLGSTHGLFLNGRRVSQAMLADGDLLGIGGATFRFIAGRLEEYVDRAAAWLLAKGLTVRAEETVLLDEVSLAIPPSSIVGLVGPSGAGKTTLLNALAGTPPAAEGGVWYGGRDVYAAYAEVSQRIGYVPQTDIMHTDLTPRRALRYAAELRFPPDVSRAEREARVEEVLGEFDMAHRADTPINRLSGGQRKRVSVGLELLTRSSVLFLDEPTSGLDPANEELVLRLLRDLAAGGRTVVVATHSVEAMRRADLLLVLAPGGRLAYYGRPERSLAYFGSGGTDTDFPDVFRSLSERRSVDWAGLFRQHADYQVNVAKPLATAAVEPSQVRAASSVRPRAEEHWRHYRVLLRRYAELLLADRRNLAALALQAPLFGGLIAVMLASRDLGRASPAETTMFMWLLVIAVTWLGSANAIREVVKERPIFERERARSLSVLAYVGSKLTLLGLVMLAQALVVVVIALAPHSIVGAISDDPRSSAAAVFGSSHVELWVGLSLAGVAALSLALLVSAAARRADQASTLLPMLLIAHTLFSQPFFTAPAAIEAPAQLSSAQWGMAAVASTADINRVRSAYEFTIESFGSAAGGDATVEEFAAAFERRYSEFERADAAGGYGARPRWAQNSDVWMTNMGVLVAMTALFAAATAVVLSRYRVRDAG